MVDWMVYLVPMYIDETAQLMVEQKAVVMDSSKVVSMVYEWVDMSAALREYERVAKLVCKDFSMVDQTVGMWGFEMVE